MSRTHTRAAAAAFLIAVCVCAAGSAGEVVSTMRNVNAVPEAQGFRLNPAFDMVGERGPDEKGDPQAFEILRPLDQGVTLGRIYTSCTCIQLVAHKRSFEPGERAVLHLRNVKETPVNGQIYAIYVQITAPIRTTLRFDTFVQSNSLINPDTAAEEGEGDGGAEADAEANAEAGGADAAEGAGEAGEDAAGAETAAATGAEGLTAEELPDMPGIEIIVPGGAAPAPAAVAVAEAEARAEVAATEAAAAAEAEVAAANAALEAARTELAAIMSTRSENLTAGVGATDAVRDEIDSFFASGTSGAAAGPGRAPSARPAATAAADSGWQVVAAAPSVPAPAAAPVAAPAPSARPATAAASAAPAAGGARAVSLITLGVRDIARSAAFYEAIGWQRAARSKYDATAFFQLHGQVLALYPIADMLREQGMADARPAPGGITLALHVATPEEVQREFDRFVAAGGVALKEPAPLAGGAVSGYVADPDGNPWEISCVPQFVLDGEGGLWLR